MAVNIWVSAAKYIVSDCDLLVSLNISFICVSVMTVTNLRWGEFSFYLMFVVVLAGPFCHLLLYMLTSAQEVSGWEEGANKDKHMHIHALKCSATPG